MKVIINMNEPQENFNTYLFPDGQVHARINTDEIEENSEVRVICSLSSIKKLVELLSMSNALDGIYAKKSELVIPYLMAARSDRHMIPGDSFDLKVIADLINSCGFDRVYLYDVHSDVSTALIHHSINMSNRDLVNLYTATNSVLIVPDAGAAKKAYKYLEWNKNIVEIAHCVKHRDMSNGNITLEVLNKDLCHNRNCVIIDDLCDGGATFLSIAEQIEPLRLALIVTHGIFSKGLQHLSKRFNHIITSDSYPTGHGEETFLSILKHSYGKHWSYSG
jgi:ribose-phosphate pyrophosphokinase